MLDRAKRFLKWFDVFRPVIGVRQLELLRRIVKGWIAAILLFVGISLLAHAWDDYFEEILELELLDAVENLFSDLMEPSRLLDEIGFFEVDRGHFMNFDIEVDSLGLPTIKNEVTIRPQYDRMLVVSAIGSLLGLIGYLVGRARGRIGSANGH